MIHSLAGGNIKNLKVADFVKVEILEGPFKGDKYFYIALGTEKVDSTVIVPLGKNNTPTKAKVLRIDKNISNMVAPVPMNRAKQVIKICKDC